MIPSRRLPICATSAVAATAFCVLCFSGASAEKAFAENWPQWRGSDYSGISQTDRAPVEWSADKNVLWRLPLPGAAGATPCVWEDHIFLTSVGGDEGQELLLLDVDAEGKERWRKVVGRGNKVVRGDEGNSASPSPCTDGEYVWATMGNGAVGCYDFEGNEVWSFDIGQRYGQLKIAFGFTSTPVLDGDRLYFQLIHSGGAIVFAVDKRTGEEVWKATRPSDARAECEHSYASPMLYRDGQREFLLTHGADYIIAHRLDDGSEIWRCGGLNPPGNYNPTLRFVASPSSTAGLIVVPSAKNGPVLGLRPDVEGDVTESAEGHLWSREHNTPDVPTPLIVDGLVYLCREQGDLICLDAKTGEEYYYERTHRQRHRASPVFADGKIYLTARDGTITVVKAGREFEILAQNELGEAISASPVFASGRLYLRSYDALYAIGGE